MKKSSGYKEFCEQHFQEIDDMESEHKSNGIKRVRKSFGLRDQDTLALWNLDVDGPEFLISGKPTDLVATDKTQVKHIDCIAVLCDAECILVPNSD
jgi:hypothetical protein